MTVMFFKLKCKLHAAYDDDADDYAVRYSVADLAITFQNLAILGCFSCKNWFKL